MAFLNQIRLEGILVWTKNYERVQLSPTKRILLPIFLYLLSVESKLKSDNSVKTHIDGPATVLWKTFRLKVIHIFPFKNPGSVSRYTQSKYPIQIWITLVDRKIEFYNEYIWWQEPFKVYFISLESQVCDFQTNFIFLLSKR